MMKMRSYEFEATAKDGYIRIPEEYANEITARVKVIVLAEEKGDFFKSALFPYFAIDTQGYRFNREEANER